MGEKKKNTYIGAVGGFSGRQGAGTEDRGAGRAAQLGEGVGDGRQGRRPQLLLLLLQPPDGQAETASRSRFHRPPPQSSKFKMAARSSQSGCSPSKYGQKAVFDSCNNGPVEHTIFRL